jgi:hypothetical protein
MALIKVGYMDRNSLDEKDLIKNELDEKPGDVTVIFRADRTGDSLIERPFSTHPDTHPVNGNYADPEDEDDDEAEEDDLILGDEDEASGDEEEFDVELEDDVDDADFSDDDLVIDTDDDIEDEEDDDL